MVVIGANEKLLTQHISGPVTSISCCKSATRLGQVLGLDTIICRLSKISGPFTPKTDQL